MHHERRSRAASGSECEAIDDTEAPRDCELQLGRQVKERHVGLCVPLGLLAARVQRQQQERAADKRNVRDAADQ